jgi:hypothetical protein
MMPRTMIDYAITALLVLYVMVLVTWGWMIFTTGPATVDNTWFIVAALAVMIPYHLLRRKRDKLRRGAKELQDTPE